MKYELTEMISSDFRQLAWVARLNITIFESDAYLKFCKQKTA